MNEEQVFAPPTSDRMPPVRIWCVELEEPCPIELSEAEQLRILRRAKLVDANDGFSRAHGRPLGDMVGRWRLDKILGQQTPEAIDLLQSFVESDYRLENFCTRERRHDGGSLTLVNNFIGTIGKRKLVRILGVSREVTDTQHLQSQIRLLQTAIDSSYDSFVIADARRHDHPLVYVNDRFLSMTGYDRDEVLERNCRFLQGTGTHSGTRKSIRESLEGGNRFQGEILNYRKDGTPFWSFLRISPVRDKYFNLTHFVGLSTDITRQKKAQFAAKEQRDELAQVSRATTLVEIGAALAHELSQPMSAILRNAQAGLRFLDQPSPDLNLIRQILSDIVRDDRRAGKVLTGIRKHFAKDSGEFAPISINQLVEDSLGLLRSDMIMKQVDLRLDLTKHLPMAMGDAIQLQQVVINLVLNAEDAMKGVGSDEPTITIRSCIEGDEICVVVDDQGDGISSEHLESVFDPFHTTKESGMGVGLSISRRIVEAHNGRIWAENRSEGGARVTFSIPIPRRDDQRD